MTKKKKDKKDKKANAVAKIARKTLGLVVRVGDALEAAVAAATPAPLAPSPSPSSGVAASPVALTTTSAPSPVESASAPFPVEDSARAIAAIEGYAIRHNLGAIEMPSRSTLIEALVGGMARHGSNFTDDHLRCLIDEQMRIHFRTLGARKGAAPDREAGS